MLPRQEPDDRSMLLLSVLWLGAARGQFLQESSANSFIDSVGRSY
jgi:hypothetical protein